MQLVKNSKNAPAHSGLPGVYSNVRNEANRLPFFLEYYRNLGVNQFYIVDNNSDDGTLEFLKSQDDVTLYWTDDSFLDSLCGLTWLDEMRNKHGLDSWCLTVDCDELLVYPLINQIPLLTFCQYLDSIDCQGLFTLMVDFYSKQPLDNIDYQIGTPFLESCQYFDSSGYYLAPFDHFPFFGVYGGPRYRCFYKDAELGQGPTMRKIPLVKWGKGIEYLSVTHSTSTLRLADISGALLHFKYLDDFKSHVAKEVSRRDRNMKDYQIYQESINQVDAFSFFDPNLSVAYKGDKQLLELGLIKLSKNYLNWNQNLAANEGTGISKEIRKEYLTAGRLDQRYDVADYDRVSYLWDSLSRPSEAEKLVSVVMPVYNAQKYVEKSVKSVLRQHEVGEILIVDDASTDDTLNICNRFAERNARVRVLRHPNNANKGAGESRNLGIKNARFPYIAFLDADDYYLERRFESSLSILKSEPEIDGVYGVQKFDFDNVELESQRMEAGLPNVTSVTGNYSGHDLFTNMNPVGKKGNFHVNTVLFSREVFDEVGLFTDMEFTEDVEMWLKMAYSLNLRSNGEARAVSVKHVHENNRMSRQNTRMQRPKVFKSVVRFSVKQPFYRRKMKALLTRYFDSLNNMKYEHLDTIARRKEMKNDLRNIIFILGARSFKLREQIYAINKKRIKMSKREIQVWIVMASLIFSYRPALARLANLINGKRTTQLTSSA